MSTVRLLVLGVVRTRGQAHGYGVHRELMSWRVDTWTSVKPSSIYHAVKQLAREGRLAATEPQRSPQGPSRVTYRITAAGEQEFTRLVEAALTDPDIEVFGAGVAFMTSLPKARVRQLLYQRLELTTDIDEQLDGMKAQWPDPTAPPHAPHLLDLWRGVFTSQTTWTARLLDRLDEFGFSTDR